MHRRINMGRWRWAKQSWKRLCLFQKKRLHWQERLLTTPISKEGFHIVCLTISFRGEQEWPRLKPPRPRRWILKVAPLIKDTTSKAQPYLHSAPVAADTSQGQGRGLWALSSCWLLGTLDYRNAKASKTPRVPCRQHTVVAFSFIFNFLNLFSHSVSLDWRLESIFI